MTRAAPRVLLVEPDAPTRALALRVLRAEGYVVDDFEDPAHAVLLLAEDAYDVAVLDACAGGGPEPLDAARALREAHPLLPIVLTGTLLAPHTLLALLRLGVEDALVKPYRPDDLRAALARALARARPQHREALAYRAALERARDALLARDASAARAALARAFRVAPLDAAVLALAALAAELDGALDDARRGYLAALALGQHDGGPLPGAAPCPREALARLDSYAGAAPCARLDERFAGAPVRYEDAPLAQAPEPAARYVRAHSAGLAGACVLLARAERGDVAHLLLSRAPRPDERAALEREALPPPAGAPPST